jgi:hypothetical protein
MVTPARRVALLGGGFSTDEDGLLDDWLLGHVGRPRPKVCFAPTASGDAPAYIDRRASYREAVATAGWAIDDGVGALFADGRLDAAVSRTPEARLYWVQADGADEAVERALPCRLLDE